MAGVCCIQSWSMTGLEDVQLLDLSVMLMNLRLDAVAAIPAITGSTHVETENDTDRVLTLAYVVSMYSSCSKAFGPVKGRSALCCEHRLSLRFWGAASHLWQVTHGA